LQIDAFQRGDMEALAEAAETSIPRIWELARAGFVTSEEGHEAYVRGVDSPDVIERLVARTLARCYTPARRRAIDSEAALRRSELEEARAVLTEHAIRTGALTTPRDDSDRAIAAEEAGHASPGIGAAQHREAMNAIVVQTLGKMDDRTRRLVELRFAGAKSRQETASALGCGPTSIGSHERRVRHQLGHALRVAFPEEKLGAATIDALLAGGALPRITAERIKQEVLRRTHQDDPAPYRIRLLWGLGALAFASALWLLMFLDVLPYYEDDLAPAPRVVVKCKSSCRIGVLAPRNTKRLAVGLRREGLPSEILLASPSGRSIRLPLGAAVKTVEVPYTAELPRSLGKRAWAVAIFSEDRLNRDQILSLTDGRISVPGVFTTSAALSLE
jgi:DNA-directed RNA polymerase specialized sigma24 family protein